MGTQGRGLPCQERSGNRRNEEKEALESNLEELERHCQVSNKDKVVHQRDNVKKGRAHMARQGVIYQNSEGKTEEMGVER